MQSLKYLSLFSGYGGFELGIQQAYDSLSNIEGEQQGRIKDDMPSDGESFLGAECIGFSEIDKYATQIYKKHFKYEECEKCRLENERKSKMPSLGDSERRSCEQSNDGAKRLTCNCKHKEYGDITKLDPATLPDFDLLTGGVPCQSWSIAGKRGGFEDERGNMWFQFSRILREKHPKFFLAENVKGLLSHDGGKSMERICEELCGCGYAIDFEVLNAKNFGVPQSRERVFIIGIRLDLLDPMQIF